MVAKSADDEKKIAHGGEYCVQTNRDSYSGIFFAYPLRQRTAEKVQTSFLHFFPKKPEEAIPCKGDNAREAIAAMRALGWRHDPSLENRFPHNSAHERDTRTWAELLRTNFLSSGLHVFPKTWPIAAEHAGVAMSISAHPPIFHSERNGAAEAAKLTTTRWEHATDSPFPGRRLALGQPGATR
jgi:hypothetical protein